MADLVDAARNRIRAYEADTGIRTRVRRAGLHGPREAFDRMVEAVVVNLAMAAASGREDRTLGFLPPARRRAVDAHEHWAFRADQWATLRDLGEAVGLWRHQAGHEPVASKRGTAPALSPGPALIALVDQHGPDIATDIMRDPDEEVIELAYKVWRAGKKTRKVVALPTGEDVDLVRKQVREVNTWLQSANIEWAGDSDHPHAMGLLPHRRKLMRKFVLGGGPWDTPEDAPKTLDKGGRLFGVKGCASWQTMSKEDRRHIRIDGEGVVELDFSSINPRLAYSHVGKTPDPDADLYRIPGLERFRADVKVLFNAGLCLPVGFKMRGDWWPDKIKEAAADDGIGVADDETGEFPLGSLQHVHGMTGAKALGLIMAAHPDIAGLFRTGIGVELQYTESCILLGALAYTRREGAVALPIHDAVLVARSKAGGGETGDAGRCQHHRRDQHPGEDHRPRVKPGVRVTRGSIVTTAHEDPSSASASGMSQSFSTITMKEAE